MRRTAFLFDDGAVLCATARALEELRILGPSLEAERSVRDLCPEILPSGFGYLRAGLRSFAGQGWLADELTLDPETTMVRWTEDGRAAARYHDRYIALGRFLAGFSSSAPDAWSREWDTARIDAFLDLSEVCSDRWRLGDELSAPLKASLTTHLDAALAVPTMLWLQGMDRLAEEAPALPDGELGRGMAGVLAELGWIDAASGEWTAVGQQARAYAPHFGIVGSYLPMFARLPDMYRGNATVTQSLEGDSVEWHVNRELNVIASAAAHRRYFADADSIFLELFDRVAVESQPRFIADMGCGDGSWLIHLYGLIRERTRRGESLDSDPLLMVGIDYNAAALEPARRALDEADVPGLLIFGDVGDPEAVRSTLAENGLRMEDGLHIRSFLDHDRVYRGADEDIPVPGWSSAAYVDGHARPLDAASVERDLVAHLRRWAPHVHRHGMVVVEAHCVAPRIAQRHLGALHSVAFDAYHAYSHQYPIEYSAFIHCCRQAGLERAGHFERHYPSSRPFVAVSLNRLLVSETESALPGLNAGAPRHDTWQPDPETDREDGRALHGLLFTGGDLRHPRQWCAAPTGFVVAGALEVIEARLAGAREGDVIRILDYGTGSGLAAIELLKACRELDIERRLEQLGATLEVHLADLPSSWFAQGFALLRDCTWTRFHSLRAADRSFLPLLEVTEGQRMDAVMANMVFHLIPPEALERVAEELASVINPGGRLLWNSPDLGPPGPYAALFHDPNRMLRKRWRELIAGSSSGGGTENSDARSAIPDSVRQAVREVRASLSESALRDAQSRADRRILPRAHAADDVAAALRRHFRGQVALPTYEMITEEILDALLVPSNQGEYFPEIRDRDVREAALSELMLGEVLPTMRESPAGTALGMNVQWTLGDFTSPASDAA